MSQKSTVAIAAFFTSLAKFARTTADLLDVLAADEGGVPEEPAKPAAPPKKAAPAAKAPEVKVAETPKPAVVEAPKPVAGNGAPDNIETQCRKAAKAYAEVYGREGLKEILGKYTQGTMADIPADKLPELLKELS